MVVAFDSSGWTDPTVQRLVNVWEQQAASRRSGPDRCWLPSTRHQLSQISGPIYWNLVSLILPLIGLSKSPYLDDGWPSFGR